MPNCYTQQLCGIPPADNMHCHSRQDTGTSVAVSWGALCCCLTHCSHSSIRPVKTETKKHVHFMSLTTTVRKTIHTNLHEMVTYESRTIIHLLSSREGAWLKYTTYGNFAFNKLGSFFHCRQWMQEETTCWVQKYPVATTLGNCIGLWVWSILCWSANMTHQTQHWTGSKTFYVSAFCTDHF